MHMPAKSAKKLTYYALLGAALIGLFLWQNGLRRNIREMNLPLYDISAIKGLCADFSEFYVFYHFTGQFPVAASLEHPLPSQTPEAIAAYIRNHGDWLVMDYLTPCNNVRCGDCGKLFLYMLDDVTPDRPPNVGRINRWMFLTSLAAVLVSFWILGRPLLGILLILLIGSDPFQLRQVYLVDNIFSLPISVTLWMIALHAPLLFGKVKTWYVFALAAASGIILASFREIRSEPATIVAALPIVYLCWPGASMLKRIGPCILLGMSFFLTGRAWGIYWDHKFADAAQFVTEHGGPPYTGLRSQHHAAWHTIACGLGDFGTDKGYAWDDITEYHYALPILKSKYDLNYTMTQHRYYFDQSYDADGVYPIKPEDLPQYTQIIKDRVLGDIRNDPIWYAKILLKRAELCLVKTTPASLALGSQFHSFTGRIVLGPAAPMIILIALFLRRFGEVKLFLLTLPLLGTAILIYSSTGTTYYGIFHLVAIAIALEALVIWISDAAKRKTRPATKQAGEVNP
jgi:hypothetical protein